MNFSKVTCIIFFIGFGTAALGYESDPQCTGYAAKSGGECVHTSECPGNDYLSGLCPTFPTNIKCCFSLEERNFASDPQCTGYENGGECIHIAKCPGDDYLSGLCPTYPTNIKCCFSIVTSASSGCDSVRIISRAEWGARSAATSWMTTPVNKAFIHHTAGSRCFTEGDCKARVQAVQNLHMDDNGWNDIGYSFLIGEDGNAYEGRGWNKQGAHTSGYNSVSLGFAMLGNFEAVLPNQAALNALENLLECGKELGYLTNGYTVAGHRDVKATLCPGQKVYDYIKTWPNYNP